jgi:TPR repeat protein
MPDENHQVAVGSAPLAAASRHLQLLHKLFPTEPEMEWLRNPAKHVANLIAKAENGDANAQNNLAYYYSGNQIIEMPVRQDFAEAAKWSRKAAEQGDAVGQCNLGAAYCNGKGVAKDSVEAVKWFRKAAEQGAVSAQYNLGGMYLRGDGVPKDAIEAVKWYRLAAERGDADAQRNLGTIYQGGHGIQTDHVEAVKWLREAALNSKFGAMDQLGLAYFMGKGVPKNEIEGLAWLKIKTGLGRDTDGHEQSEEHRKRMELAVEREKITAAQKRCLELLEEVSARRRARTAK